MTYTPSQEAIEAAAQALWKWFEDNAASNIPAPSSTDRELAREALSAAGPIMEAQAKAEALREAADDPTLRLSGHSGISISRLRARAATVEGGNR